MELQISSKSEEVKSAEEAKSAGGSPTHTQGKFLQYCEICGGHVGHKCWDCPDKSKGMGMGCHECCGPCKKNVDDDDDGVEHWSIEMVKYCIICGGMGKHWGDAAPFGQMLKWTIPMIVGEVANFIAYAFAPAVLVTPLGALSIIISAVLAHFILKERLHMLCISAVMLYVGSVIVLVFILIFHFVPRCGQTNVLVFTGICSLMGSLSVMSVKALGTALKLTFEGKNQLIYPETWFFMLVVTTCVITQMNYLNKALDTFNTAVVSPIYYVMFTTLAIIASVIMFKIVGVA